MFSPALDSLAEVLEQEPGRGDTREVTREMRHAVRLALGLRTYEPARHYQGCRFEKWGTYPEDQRDCLTMYEKSIDARY